MKVKFDRRSKEITFIDSGDLNANDINWQVLHAEVTPPLSVGETLWIQFQKEVATHVSMMSKNGDLYEFEFPSEVINSAGEWSLQFFVRGYTGQTLLYQDASKTTTFTVENGLKGEGIEGPVTHATIASLYSSVLKSEENALISENNSFKQAYDAQQSAKNAKQSETNAANSASNAASSEANAVANANQAKSSAEAALGVLEDAEEAKDAAEKSATNAKKSEENALGSEQLAAQHAAEVKASLQEVLEEAKAYTDNEIATFDFIKIGNLPETGLINKIYLVPKTSSENNDLFDEYLWVNNTWEFLGTKKVEVDLSDYVKKLTGSGNKIYAEVGGKTNGLPFAYSPVANTIAYRDSNGNFQVNAPVGEKDCVPNDYLQANYVQQSKSGGARRVYSVNRQGEQEMLLAADIASAVHNGRIAMYMNDTYSADISTEPNGALVTKTPVKPYQCANKKYVDEAVANAGGGGGSAIIDVEELPTENINTKSLYRVFNEDGEQELWYYASYDEGEYEWQRIIGSNEFFDYTMTDASLSANQQAAVMDLIREYGGGSGGGVTIEDVQDQINQNLFYGKSLASGFGAEYDEDGNLLTIDQVYVRKDEIENGGGSSSGGGSSTEDYLTETELAEYLNNNGYVTLPPGENIEGHIRIMFQMGSISANDIQVFTLGGMVSLMDYLDTIGGNSSSALGTKVTLAQLQENLATYCAEKRIIRIVPTTDSILRDMEQCQGAILVPLKNPSGVPYGVLYTSHTEGTEEDAYYYMYSLSISPNSASISYSLYYHVYKDMSGTLDDDQRMDLDDDICEFYVI